MFAAGVVLGSTSTTSTTCAQPLVCPPGTPPLSGTFLAASSPAPAQSKQIPWIILDLGGLKLGSSDDRWKHDSFRVDRVTDSFPVLFLSSVVPSPPVLELDTLVSWL